MLREIAVGVLLGVQSYWDLRYKAIPDVVSLAVGIIGLCLWNQGEKNIAELWCALLPGMVCLFIGKVSKEAIGYGDGILLCILGIYYTVTELMELCLIAISTAGICGLVLLVFFQKRGQYELPFVPFLLLGWIVRMVGVYGGIWYEA